MKKTSQLLIVLIIILNLLSASCINQQVKLENNDWSEIWIYNANQLGKPRVLLVGDSITGGYFDIVDEQLSSDVFLGRYTTSKFISNPDFHAELKIILNRYRFKVIHINNGLHGWDYSQDDYRRGLEELLDMLGRYAPESTVIWGQTTPVRNQIDLNYLDELNRQVIQRNQIAQEIMEKNNVVINDLYQLMIEHPEYYRDDGLHFNQQGQELQGKAVSEIIKENLDR